MVYCEMCKKLYSNIDAHIMTKKHRKRNIEFWKQITESCRRGNGVPKGLVYEPNEKESITE